MDFILVSDPFRQAIVAADDRDRRDLMPGRQ